MARVTVEGFRFRVDWSGRESPDFRRVYRWSVVAPDGTRWTGSDLNGPRCGDSGECRPQLASLLAFVGAALESVDWETRNPGCTGENSDLFPRPMLDALAGHSDALAMARTELECKSVRFPTVREVLAELRDVRCGEGFTCQPGTEVRLQVTRDGSWQVHSGDPSYDTDHRGYWGAGSVSPDDSVRTLRETARDLLAQAREALYMSGDF